MVVAGLSAIIAALAYESIREKDLSWDEAEKRTKELLRRLERLHETIQALENTEGELHAEEGPPEAGEEEALGQVRFELVLQRCREVEQLSPQGEDAQLLVKGLRWAHRMLLKELRVATRLTERGDDVEHADGSKLDKLLKQPRNFRRVARRAGFTLSRADVARLEAAVDAAWHVRRVQRQADVKKAFLLLLRVRGPWKWVMANSAVAVASGLLSGVALDYQAQVLETFKGSGSNTRRRFATVAAAWGTLELCNTLLGVICSQLSARGDKMASRLVQVQLFRAVARQELPWWEAKGESELGSIDRLIRWNMPYEVSRVLNLPRDFLFRFANILSCAWRMQQQSNSLMFYMIGIYWMQVLVRNGIRRLREFLEFWASRGVILPSEDDKTFRFALRPEFATLYQSFVRGPTEAEIFEQSVLQRQRCDQRMSAVATLTDPANKIMRQGTTIAQYAVVGDLVQRGTLGESSARAMIDHANGVNHEIFNAYNDWSNAQVKCTELARAYDLITLRPKIDPDIGELPEGRAQGHIVFDDVHFEYPNRRGGNTLQGVSFEIHPGEVVGIVGQTGCGKSTLFRLVQRFYDATSGSICLDGTDIRLLNPEWLRGQMATVSQEPELIPLTVRDNICLGCRHKPSTKEIEDACRAANIWDVLTDKRKFPEGLQTKMRAVKNVAGGEKQRICIARAILANPSILLLDEATSALDQTTEGLVQEALEKLMKGRTTLVIAHRLSTIRNADKIVGMQDGRVMEVGSHEELLQKATDDPTCIYGKLWREQDGAVPEEARDPKGDVAGQLGHLRKALQRASRSRDVEQIRRATLEAIGALEEEAARLARERAKVPGPPALQRSASAPAHEPRE